VTTQVVRFTVQGSPLVHFFIFLEPVESRSALRHVDEPFGCELRAERLMSSRSRPKGLYVERVIDGSTNCITCPLNFFIKIFAFVGRYVFLRGYWVQGFSMKSRWFALFSYLSMFIVF